MSAANWQEWGWTIAAASLAVVGVVLLIWSLFWDRARGRKRCPKCWYDMNAAATLVCPECGKVAKSEQRLLRTRRRWRGVALSLLLLIAAYGSWVCPRAILHGWPGAVPTWVLIEVVDRDCTTLAHWNMSRLKALEAQTGGKARVADRLHIQFAIFDELCRRARDREMMAWEQRRLVRLCAIKHSTTPVTWSTRNIVCSNLLGALGSEQLHALGLPPDQLDQPQIVVECRRRWPVGAPIVAQISGLGYSSMPDTRLQLLDRESRLDLWSIPGNPVVSGGVVNMERWYLWKDRTSSLGKKASGSAVLHFLGAHHAERDGVLREWPIDVPIEVCSDPDLVVHPVSLPEIDAALANIQAIAAPVRGIYLGFGHDIGKVLFENPELTLALRAASRHT